METANWHQDPVSDLKQTLLPTQIWRASPLASTTLPVPYRPHIAGKGLLNNVPFMSIMSDGLKVETSTGINFLFELAFLY